MQIASDARVFRPHGQDKEPSLSAVLDACEAKAPLQTQLDDARQILGVQSTVDAPIVPAVQCQCYIHEGHAEDEYQSFLKPLGQPEKKEVTELLRTK